MSPRAAARTTPATARAAASAVAQQATVFAWRLPAITDAASYLAPVAGSVVVVGLVAALRLLTGHADGWVLALAAAAVALMGQVLNQAAGLPAARELHGRPGWAGAVALGCEVAVAVLAVLRLRSRAVPDPREV